MNMKKFKKFAICLATATAVFSACFMLAACGDDETSGLDTGGDGDDFVGLKSEKVSTAEEWAAAFDFSDMTNVSVKMKGMDSMIGEEAEQYQKWDTDKIEVYSEEYVSTNGSDYRKNVSHVCIAYRIGLPYSDNFGTYESTQYYYRHDYETNKWDCTVQGINKDLSDVSEYFISQYLDVINKGYTPFSLADIFSDFVYDEENYEYVASWENYPTLRSNIRITIKIKDGILAEMSMGYNFAEKDSNGEDVNHTIFGKLELYDIGTTVVEIPQVE